MSRGGFWRFPVVDLVLVGLVLATCLAGVAEAASPAYRVCSAVNGEELSASKSPPLSLLEIPVAHTSLPGELSPSRAFRIDLTPDFVSADPCQDLSSRAPPLLL